MKTHLFLITFALSSAAWAADPAPATTAAPAADATAPATQEVKPAAEQQAAPAATASEQKAAPATEQAGFSRGSVVRSIFTTAVKDREPVDKLNNEKSDASQIYFFTELRDMSGQTAIHRWEHNGKVAAEVKFNVRGPRWRVWSSKTFSPNAEGEWKVSVLNGAGEVIAEDVMDYTGPAAAQKPAAAEKPAGEQPAPQAEPAQAPSTDAMPK
jgi:hypothetical protein